MVGRVKLFGKVAYVNIVIVENCVILQIEMVFSQANVVILKGHKYYLFDIIRAFKYTLYPAKQDLIY